MNIPVPTSRKDQALDLLEQIRSELENDELDQATEILSQLSEHVASWQRTEHMHAARAWLDDALQDDLLIFDDTQATEHLTRWAKALNNTEPNPELEHYREQVTKRIEAKNAALQIRGVLAHCDELLQRASEMERGADPPAPDFLMKQYYRKARGVAQAAKVNYKDDVELERLVQRIERIHGHKETAANIYAMALENSKYTNALHNLDQLPSEILVPRYTAISGDADEIKLSYHGMISTSQAREELNQMAKSWASTTMQQAIQSAKSFLEAHEPQEALDKLDLRENVTRFLSVEQQADLQAAKTQAMTDQRNQAVAAERAASALALAASDSLRAWDEYTQAFRIYQWVDAVTEARQVIIKSMRTQLKSLLQQADTAFHDQRDMGQVRQICQKAKSQFSDKDVSLDELLTQIAEFNEMVNSYEEYIQTATEILTKVKNVLKEDVHEANELLSQVESYPEFVLEAFENLYELRQQVNQRLNAEHTYSTVYGALRSNVISEVTQAIEQAKTAITEFKEDPRFPQIMQALQYHMAYVSAQQQAEKGSIEQAVQLLKPVLNSPNHPDYQDARELNQQLERSLSASPEIDPHDSQTESDEDVS